MLKAERQHKIAEFVNTRGVATVDELSDDLKVSKATIRRDLEEMHQDGIIMRTHGGAVRGSDPMAEEVPINIRAHLHKDEKVLVAAAAAELIEEGSTIFIGPGTTAQQLAGRLGKFHHLTVLTNDIDVAKAISYTDNILIVTGGQLKRGSCTLYGFFTEQMLNDLKVDTAFMAVDAVDSAKGFMDFGVDEVTNKRMVIRNAKRCIMLCDLYKFETSALVNVCPLNDADIVVTNEGLAEEYIEKLLAVGVEVVCAPKSGKSKQKEDKP
ncbi:MAG: DeoR/GlpR family DNA-binding transcription regulator [Oscillospiraceae bacterium]|nr:DeoR/GlpR family DNA-binding transcription regulator [Oscillospiraceae bacterium]